MYDANIDTEELAWQYFAQGYSAHMSGDYDMAQEWYRKSIKSYPTAQAHTYLGWSMSMQKRYKEALEQCFVAIQMDPNYGNPYNDIGSYYIELGQIGEAEPYLIRATQIGSYQEKHFAYYNLGQIYEMRGNFLQAFRYYKRSYEENKAFLKAKQKVKKLLAILN